MNFRFFLIGIGLATLLCLISFLIILFFFNPFEAGPSIILLFYLSLFLSLVGFLGLAGFFLRRVFIGPSLRFNILRTALRQAALLALLLTGTLCLKNSGWLTWLTGMVLLIVVIGLEAYFLKKKGR